MANIDLGASTLLGDNGAARVQLYDASGVAIPRASGAPYAVTDLAVPIGALNDENYRTLRADRIGGLATAQNTILLSEPFEGTTIATHRMTVATTTFTQAQTLAGGLNFNSAAITTAAAAALVTTNRRFVKLQRAPLHAKFRARAGHVTNAVMEFGFGNPASQTNAPTVGAYWQVTAGGVVQPVLTFNGVDVTGASVTMPSGWQSNFYTWDVILDDDEVSFFVQDTSTGLIIAERRIKLAVTQTRLWDATRLSAYARLHFPAAPATAATLLLASMDVLLLDCTMNKPWAHVASHMGLGSETIPTTVVQAGVWANSAAPGSSALSNTTAGSASLGGLFQFVAVAGAATDYALFGYTVPAPYSFVCTGIDIDVWNTGAAVAATPTLMVWGVSPDQAAISLATGTNRRVALGANSFPIGAVVGAVCDRRLAVDFSHGPLVTNANRILVIILRMPVATATASQVVQGCVTIKGYHE